MNSKERLIQKFRSRTALLGVIGMGYVGLPSAVTFAEEGFRVIGIDVNPEKVDALNAGVSYIEDVASARLQPLVAKGMLRASSRYADLADVDAIMICVPTPLNKTKDPDISYIIDSTEQIVTQAGGRGKLIVLESTTYPGSTQELILPRLQQNGDVVGRDFFLAFSPERTDPGRTDYTFQTTPKVIGATTEACREVALALYGTVVAQLVPVSGTATAEMVKLLENTFRAVNIGLVNEMALMCDKLGLDVWEVIEAAATKPYGFMKFTPGPGLGGHCIPVDPHYLSWKLRMLDYRARFIELAAEVNHAMPDFVVGKVAAVLNEDRKPVNGSRVLVLGVAYKPNVSDMRESPALDILLLLQAQGAVVAYHDPFVPQLALDGVDLVSVALDSAELAAADCVLVVTDHAGLDWELVVRESAVVVDTRNALRGVGEGLGRVVRI